jgi:hypothetical protein
MSGAALLTVAVALGGLASADSTQNGGYWGGVSESGQTVNVAAQQSKTTAPVGTVKADAPAYVCSDKPDVSVNGLPGPNGATDGSWYQWGCTGDASRPNTVQIPKADLAVWVPLSTPVDLAQKAASQIRLPSPVVN